MSKYLEYFNGAFDNSIIEKVKPENRPYIGYSKEENKVTYSQRLVTPNYLCFEPIDENGNQLAVAKLADWSNTQYSFDKVTWTEFPTNPSNPLNPVFITVDKPIYLKGNNPKGYTNFETMEGSKIIGIGKYNVSGDVTTLLNEVGNVKDLSDCYLGCLAYLFGELDSGSINLPAIDIVDASKLILPATTLVYGCYSGMFYDCTALTIAPELPATTLVGECYGGMFAGCTSLTTAPELPATTLAEDCYGWMFSNCTSLTTAPELPATELAENCYAYMFDGCTSLVTTPKIYAEEAGEKSCYSMFCNCTSLKYAEDLNIVKFTGPYSCGSMFYNCTSLVKSPKLPATTLGHGCYSYMFAHCKSLVAAPELPATTPAVGCYSNMFSGCTSLTTAPELPATTLAGDCYYMMFNGCVSLTHIKCLATDMSANQCITRWVYNVSNTGTFVKHPDATWSTGESGIPEGWTVKDAVL